MAQAPDSSEQPGYVGADGNSYRLASQIGVQAMAVWAFRPTGNSLAVTMDARCNGLYSGFSGLSVSLFDLATSSDLVDLNGNNTWGSGATVNEEFDVDSSHTYELTVDGWTDTFASDFSSADFTASLQAVPEPAKMILNVILLVPIAVNTVGVFRKNGRIWRRPRTGGQN